jgi:hypothetical protein
MNKRRISTNRCCMSLNKQHAVPVECSANNKEIRIAPNYRNSLIIRELGGGGEGDKYLQMKQLPEYFR